MSDGTLIEVALAAPPFAVFTYRDPRRNAQIPLGAQVVAPLGSRRITGFVVGHPPAAPKEVRDIEEVLENEPALDPEILWLCRWTASYYLAPLGEVLRAALPQAERAEAQRRLRLSEDGRWFLRRLVEGKAGLEGLAFDEVDRQLLARLGTARGLSQKSLRGTVEEKRLPQLLERGFVEVGDEVTGRSQGRQELWAVLSEGATAPVFGPRDKSRRVFWERISTERALRVTGLSPALRSAAQALAELGVLRLENRELDGAAPIGPTAPPPKLNSEQAAALAAMTDAVKTGWAAFLLQGVTGSGKTEVYLRLIEDARARGRGALVLVPEIALTPQLAARFRARFGDDVAVLHSGLAPAERRAAWRRLRAGEVGIALGARSAVFAPVPKLGVVVVDEEHDPSFKQEEGLRYNGRDLALVRAQRAEAIAVLGSATPSLESFRQAELGRYRRLLLPTRANPIAAARPLPPVEIIDLRREPPQADGLFSRRLVEAMRETVARGEQVILFLNRRGFAPLVLCRACGQSLRCKQCAVSLTFHRARAELACHYCGAACSLPRQCPGCHKAALVQLGTGTERAESVVREYLPEARVARLDRDTAGVGKAGGLEGALAKVHRREIDILVGTQMVTKGHDFAGVTLVGVLLPDQGMNLPDFRAAERTFQLLEQVAGRAGRAEQPGRVMIQTYAPEHAAIAALPAHDYEGFVRAELGRREEAGYPPFARLVALRIEGADAAEVARTATEVATRARTHAAGVVRIRGPAEAPLALLRGQTRWQVWLASEDRTALAQCARRAGEGAGGNGVRVTIDVDPHSVL
jgi:primosomal protein N' (replication factor Y) (superfamily II helicase)